MKPKTKLHHEVLAISKDLEQGLADNAKSYARKRMPTWIRLRYSNRFECHECGHEWKGPKLDREKLRRNQKMRCPSCGHRSTLTAENPGIHRLVFDQLEHHGRFQVIRQYVLSQWTPNKGVSEYDYVEGAQHFIQCTGKPVGRMTSLLTPPVGSMFMGGNSFPFGGHGDLTLYGGSQSVYGQGKDYFAGWYAPGRNLIHPELRKRGYRATYGDRHTLALQHLFPMLLRDSRTETLMKLGFPELAGNRHLTGEFWKPFLVGLRHGLPTDKADWGMYFDYLKIAKRLDLDIHNPQIAAPTDIREAHDTLLAKWQKAEAKKKAEDDERKKWLHQTYDRRMKRYERVRVKDGQIEVVPITTLDDMQKEGHDLNHCIYASGYYEREDSLCLSIRVAGQRTETAEINLKSMTIAQCRGRKNRRSKHHNRIVPIIEQKFIPQLKRLQA